MKDFYLNRDFFNCYLGCFYPLGDDFFLNVKSLKTVPCGYRKFYVYDVAFCVQYEHEFVECFFAQVFLIRRRIQLRSVHYILDSDLKQALHQTFPLSPAWLIPCTRFSLWLRRCYMSLMVYRNADWI